MPPERGWTVNSGGDADVGIGAALPLMLTEKELVASPAPPCHSSKPASTSISHQDGWM